MRVAIQFGSYNERRYGRPWVAVVTSWPVGENPEVRWGSFVGKDGQAGEVEVEANVDDVVRWGQKDHRNSRGTESNWGIVSDDGTVSDCTAASARKHWNSRTVDAAVADAPSPLAGISDADLVAEIKRRGLTL